MHCWTGVISGVSGQLCAVNDNSARQGLTHKMWSYVKLTPVVIANGKVEEEEEDKITAEQ